jgi:3-isopropylmalate dehydratase small subunit
MAKRLTSSIFVVGDNIDTDQIIPAHFLTRVPTIPDEYEKLGQRLIDRCKTGDTATIDFDSDTLELNGEVYPLKPAARPRGC